MLDGGLARSVNPLARTDLRVACRSAAVSKQSNLYGGLGRAEIG